ncbi:hypothetical protein [Sphingomonas colocasiae]|uniref:Uncharacterized protein n=1 Tax=Sphingomonas colocasiae TaxID=1848973 RepID=A0ABS7PWI4_9SPHN|nr:hypothetical protein [Sphingomonas colocasiae]MBY8825729.1 hypothetical protein [Sphingomonas colocasiae]
MKSITGGIISALLFSGTALAQEKQSDLDKAGNIASQPVRDLGIKKGEIPEVLQKAVQAPYASPPRGCRPINVELGELNAALGEDFGVGTEANENRTGKIAEAVGKTIVNSLIPFRGLVREISGAAPAERRLQAAVAAGIARRGYLRGLAGATKCRIAPIVPAVSPAAEKPDPDKDRK